MLRNSFNLGCLQLFMFPNRKDSDESILLVNSTTDRLTARLQIYSLGVVFNNDCDKSQMWRLRAKLRNVRAGRRIFVALAILVPLYW